MQMCTPVGSVPVGSWVDIWPPVTCGSIIRARVVSCDRHLVMVQDRYGQEYELFDTDLVYVVRG